MLPMRIPLGRRQIPAQFLRRSARTVAGRVALDTPPLSQRDKGLISFDDEGAILVSPNVMVQGCKVPELGGRKLSLAPSEKQKRYLKVHRDRAEKLLGRKLVRIDA